MPRELPGFRWDEHRQRYFPLPAQPTAQPTQPSVERPRRWALPTSYRALLDLRSVCRTIRKDALVHQIQSLEISHTDKATRSIIPLQGLASAFQTISHSGRTWNFVGDTFGWFCSSVLDQESDTVDRWQPQYNLSSEVSSIVASSTTCIATSFGPGCTILYVSIDSPIEGMHVSRIDSRRVHDIWTTDLHGSRLVLGANKQAVVIEDIAVDTSLRSLPTQSDVFALAQREHILYTGLRNGGIVRFDMRDKSSQHRTFQRTSSITGLKHLHDHQLLASFIDGGIASFDLRFPVRTPLMEFTGNVNSYTTRLPLATDPYEKYLFAAGQDNKIRLWSLTTGGPALGAGSARQRAFERAFEHRVAALQVAKERDGMCLWAASGTELCRYSLGHRSGTGV